MIKLIVFTKIGVIEVERFKAYADSYRFLTVQLERSMYEKNLNYYFVNDEEIEELKLLDGWKEKNYHVLKFRMPSCYTVTKNFYIQNSLGDKVLLRIGNITGTNQFDYGFKYDGKLGFEYTKKYTKFRVWAPTAKDLNLLLYKEDKPERIKFNYMHKGMWEVKVDGDLDGMPYMLEVCSEDTYHIVNDPYALSSNGK